MRNLLKGSERLISLALMLSLVLVAFSLVPHVSAAMTITLNPIFGNVGTQVQVTANLTTSNGAYDILFENVIVSSGTAIGNDVTTNFTVPQTAAGTHTVMITDLNMTGENATTTFTVYTAYSIGVVTTQKNFQEGDQIPISVNITGGNAGIIYANVTVTAPDNSTYANVLNVPISASGNGTVTTIYPTDFSGNAKTEFVGTYGVSFNSTFATSSFAVTLTNATQYHRGETVNIKALYEQNENVTVTVVGENIDSALNLSDPTGLISYDWIVPPNASIGTYTVSVVSVAGPTTKTPPDVQNFTVPGLPINVTAKNLAGEPVSSVNLTAYENGTLVDNQTTSSTGLAILRLEIGTYNCTAIASGEKVGELIVRINDTTPFDIVCNLTNLRVHVVSVLNGSELNVPEAGVFLGPSNQTIRTDINGVAVIQSLLPDSKYSLNVSRYGVDFNVTTDFQLLINGAPVAWFDVIINCPNSTLQVMVMKRDGQPFSNALVKIQEALGVPSIEQNTDAGGVANFTAPFGRYTVQIYDASMEKLNETTVDLFGNQNLNMSCSLYGLTVSVTVVDYFGQGIANMRVNLQRAGQTIAGISTGPDGTATINNLAGGELDIIISSSGMSTPIAARTVDLEDSTTIQIKVDKYVVFAGMFVETSQLAAIILIILVVAFVLFLELYRRRRVRGRKTENESSDKES